MARIRLDAPWSAGWPQFSFSALERDRFDFPRTGRAYEQGATQWTVTGYRESRACEFHLEGRGGGRRVTVMMWVAGRCPDAGSIR